MKKSDVLLAVIAAGSLLTGCVTTTTTTSAEGERVEITHKASSRMSFARETCRKAPRQST